MVGFDFAPKGWALCDGQLLPISQNQALFTVIGTQYGGNGQTTFGLPDLRGCVPINQGQGPGRTARSVGESGGAEQITLTEQEMPSHQHSGVLQPKASTKTADQSDPTNHYPAVEAEGRETVDGYHEDHDTQMGGTSYTTSRAGMSLPHSNMQPYLTINFIIALWGIYPQHK